MGWNPEKSGYPELLKLNEHGPELKVFWTRKGELGDEGVL